jgi:hypothetical protein
MYYYNGTGGTGGMFAESSISKSNVYIFANSGYSPNCS